MNGFDASLKKLCSHLNHDQFVRQVLSVPWQNFAGPVVFSSSDIREEFREELWDEIFRTPSGM